MNRGIWDVSALSVSQIPLFLVTQRTAIWTLRECEYISWLCQYGNTLQYLPAQVSFILYVKRNCQTWFLKSSPISTGYQCRNWAWKPFYFYFLHFFKQCGFVFLPFFLSPSLLSSPERWLGIASMPACIHWG